MIRILCLNVSRMDPSIYEILHSRAFPERRERADRCRRREDALLCIGADALLRYGVKRELGITDFTLGQNDFGKPFIPEAENFCFNLSHSGDWVVLAFGDSPVGIDVEEIRPDAGKEKIARRHFIPEEQKFVFQKPEGTAERFFSIWTAKESYLKYRGTGLTVPLNSFSVLDMASPSFFSWILEGDYALTLCAGERPEEPAYVTAEQLL